MIATEAGASALSHPPCLIRLVLQQRSVQAISSSSTYRIGLSLSLSYSAMGRSRLIRKLNTLRERPGSPVASSTDWNMLNSL